MITKHKVLFVVLAIIGVLLTLQINGALATTEETPAASSKLKKCGYEMGVPGIFEFQNEAGQTIGGLFMTADPTIITVTGKKEFDSIDPKTNKPIKLPTYRFDASYDKPFIFIFCPIHQIFEGPVPFEIYSKEMPPAALEGFYLPVEAGKCTEDE